MAIEYLKKGLDEKQRIEDNDKVKKIVEETLRKIESEGDKYLAHECAVALEEIKIVIDRDNQLVNLWSEKELQMEEDIAS